MANPMLAELDEVVRMMDSATEGPFVVDEYADVTANGEDVARIVNCDADAHLIARSVNFLRTHHATLADMAKRLEAVERDAARYRWLREQDGSLAARAQVSFNMGFDWYEAHGEGLDAAIDATQEGAG